MEYKKGCEINGNCFITEIYIWITEESTREESMPIIVYRHNLSSTKAVIAYFLYKYCLIKIEGNE